ncbi:MAG: calcium/sodium antiporter [Erysipelotrichaceae bacterium]|nr:calcium/sodium antiporter [Erysipelotrichaceae bacterium]MBQ9987052.1 calcium/sodium antiporter [Erysipelotrichales bacterium]MBR3693221.1 calcium/sodium antiporter [Erysipelotrichales bacterium]
MDFVKLLIGFVLLIKGADFFVEGSSSLAKIMRVPTVIIGLTIVAMGTSAPELSVSVNAALAGSNDIAISNVIGSNVFNSMVVVGMCAFLRKFAVNKDIANRDLPINILISIVLCFMMLDNKLSRVEGCILLVGMVLFIFMMVRSALQNREEGEDVKTISLPMSFVYIIGGLIGVVYGGDLVVDAATAIATMFGLSQNFIGLTIVAVGTSLPELVTSVVATKKGESALALGNAVGSNIFNILLILGMSAVISPLNVLSESLVDAMFMLGSAMLLFVFAKTKHEMNKGEGIVCMLVYVAYTVFLFIR